MKLWWKIIVIIIPIVLIMGLFAFYRHGQFIVPTAEEFMQAISQLEAVEAIEDFTNLVEEFNYNVNNSFNNVHDLFSFFEAIGRFFQSFGYLFQILFTVIRIPFEVIGWVAQFIFAG